MLLHSRASCSINSFCALGVSLFGLHYRLYKPDQKACFMTRKVPDASVYIPGARMLVLTQANAGFTYLQSGKPRIYPPASALTYLQAQHRQCMAAAVA